MPSQIVQMDRSETFQSEIITEDNEAVEDQVTLVQKWVGQKIHLFFSTAKLRGQIWLQAQNIGKGGFKGCRVNFSPRLR